MKGLVVWAQSACRSQMSLYRELGRVLAVPIVIPVWFYKKHADYIDNRNAVGFCDDEYADMNILPVGEDFDKGLAVLSKCEGYSHLFCNYQVSANYRRLQKEAVRRGMHTAIGSESPCNMFCGWRRFAKELYFRTRLKWKVGKAIANSVFYVNYSGDDDQNLKVIGWPSKKIVPFGYYPDPIPSTSCCLRSVPERFEILSTGAMTWHRGSDVLVSALEILYKRGVSYHATITQKGPLLANLKAKAKESNLPIDFTGFMPLESLNKAYETCSIYVGAGRHEPWGMRLNDALNCGAPLVVSSGMGGCKMVRDYKCGAVFENENPIDLADKLEQLIENHEYYLQVARNAVLAAKKCSPRAKAKELIDIINERFPEWMN